MWRLNNPASSVVILTRNRAHLLSSTLRSVAEQTVSPRDYEIIIIDDESTDTTPDVVEKFKYEYPQHIVLYHRVQHGDQAKGRNAGLMLARGKFLFYTDDDCVVPPNWIECLLRIMRAHPKVVGAGGTYITPPTTLAHNRVQQFIDGMLWFYRASDTVKKCSSSFYHNPGVGNTGNICYRRQVLLTVGGFDENKKFSTGMGVDFELKKRLCNRGWLLYYIPLHVFHLKELRDAQDLFRWGFTHGMGSRYFAHKFSDVRLSQYGYHTWESMHKYVHIVTKVFSKRFALYYLAEKWGKRMGWKHMDSILSSTTTL
ncbi:MAG: glycosyltransferase family 2 protein [Parcubacteria group bacterium]|nr:glycosyltransferase family 2 protein [Parcubacteria group bacterium]